HVKATLGGVPNLAAAMAESPSLLRAFFAVREIYAQGTLSAGEVQVLSLANAFENDCDWCMAFHTLMAQKSGVSDATIDALRAGRSPDDARARALSEFTRALIQHRGAVPPAALDTFRAAGFTSAQVLEVILGAAFSVMANYAHHIVHAPLDDMLSAQAWTNPSGGRQRV
ncbi:MAG TPA: carboxymuconolactone decarboxylase family protein, partial [Gemmatimonadaceae bacterium]|nr:carboxymuconolactone decarboxylase family protein [Gemmatimonadaceae bacterium]